MRNRYINLFILCFVACVGYAQPVSIEKATRIGVDFYNDWSAGNVGTPALRARAANAIVQTKIWKQKNRNCMYVINLPDSGWVLVSGDERTMPILAMSSNGTFPEEEEMPPAMFALLEDYADEIMFIQDSVSNAIVHPDWQLLENNTVLIQSRNIDNGNGSNLYTPGTGLLNRPYRGEVSWNQQGHNGYDWDYVLNKPIYNCNYTYNKFCPKWYLADGQCGTYVGCTAVAMAQIMWYWQWPHTGYIHSGIDTNGNGIGAVELHLYDWDKMPTELTDATPMEEVDMVAGFLRDCGYAVEMKYGEDGSASTQLKAKAALINTFSYSNDIEYKIRMVTANWDRKIRDEINAGRPVLYRGQRNNNGHEFVIDGYDAVYPDKFHVNWGYGGNYNVYCTFADLGFENSNGETIKYDNFQTALFGIQPAPACGSASVNGGNNYRVGVAGEVSVSNLTVPSGQTAVYYSGTSVRLLPGFHASAGSHTHVAIQNFPCSGIAPLSARSADHEDDLEQKTDLLSLERPSVSETLVVYPNPTGGNLTVESSKLINQLELYGLDGEKQMESQGTTIDLHPLQVGMYILVVRFSDGTTCSCKVAKSL